MAHPEQVGGLLEFLVRPFPELLPRGTDGEAHELLDRHGPPLQSDPELL
jgi:hypothetical protein